MKYILSCKELFVGASSCIISPSCRLILFISVLELSSCIVCKGAFLGVVCICGALGVCICGALGVVCICGALGVCKGVCICGALGVSICGALGVCICGALGVCIC